MLGCMEETDSLRLTGDSPPEERRKCDRRQGRKKIFFERRTGFDRRMASTGARVGVVDSAVLYLRNRPVALIGLLGMINIFNMVDFSLTLNVLRAGGGEANPIMRSLLTADPIWAGLFKMTALLLATGIVWYCRRYRLALQAALVAAGVFCLLLIYHLVGLTVLS